MNNKLKVEKNVSLKPFNTFGVEAKAHFFTKLNHKSEAIDFFSTQSAKFERVLVLGGGSNILFTQDFDGIVVKMQTLGIQEVRQDQEHLWLKVEAGENWHNLVSYCVSKKWSGIENLALIPGTSGAAPIQNIGAYGVEIKDLLEEVEVWDKKINDIITFRQADCQFGYRESRFKAEKDRYVVLSILLKLSLVYNPNTSYAAIANYLAQKAIPATLESIFDAVIEIRRSKLPDPEVLGNCGSFFKNPLVSLQDFERITLEHPETPYFAAGENFVKIPAAWLIEKCGWKGKQIGNVGCYRKQALVLINATGKAQGTEVWEFAGSIQRDVKDRFGIELQPEVQIVY
jgi:UDP-N-acetylmuramate dehydrogenase